MAKRELSSTIRNLKFMQRASPREEKPKIEEEEEAVILSDGNFVSPGSVSKKCVVIMDGDPHPGAIKGRMSFQKFNPAIDKLNGIAPDPDDPETSSREDGSPMNGTTEDRSNSDANGDLKRKQAEIVPETQFPNKSPRNGESNHQSSPNSARSSSKQAKLESSALRPPKFQRKRK